MFGYLDEGGEICNLQLKNVVANLRAKSRVASLVVTNVGKISYCSAIGDIDNQASEVGGLVAINGGIIINCFADVNVSAEWLFGGLVSNNYGLIQNCYSLGDVLGCNTESPAPPEECGTVYGGFIGNNYGTVRWCYSSGLVTGISGSGGGFIGFEGPVVHSVIGCFWDVQSSGMSNGISNEVLAGVNGRDTSDMYQKSTFVDAGWFFLGESGYANEEPWLICDGSMYPVLV